jgi:hypothetical protein
MSEVLNVDLQQASPGTHTASNCTETKSDSTATVLKECHTELEMQQSNAATGSNKVSLNTISKCTESDNLSTGSILKELPKEFDNKSNAPEGAIESGKSSTCTATAGSSTASDGIHTASKCTEYDILSSSTVPKDSVKDMEIEFNASRGSLESAIPGALIDPKFAITLPRRGADSGKCT